jgi:hypothetical protein
MSERPLGAPLHGKRGYVLIGLTNGTSQKFLSFMTGWTLNLSPVNTANAVVSGGDAVADVEVHGIIAKATINLLFTSTEIDFLLALRGESTDTVEVNYDKAVRDMTGANPSFVNVARVDAVMSVLEDSLVSGTNISLNDLRNKTGYTIELNSAAITGLEINSRVGEYATARIELSTGRFIINSNDVRTA